MPRTTLFDDLAPWAAGAADRWCARNGIDGRLRPDAIQEALIECWRATCRFDSRRGAAKQYCMRRMAGAIRDFLRRQAPLGYRSRRKKNWRGVYVLAAEDLVGFDPVDKRCAAEKRRADAREVLDDVGAKISGRDKLVWICLCGGMPQYEIARRLGMSAAGVSNRVRAIRERFAPGGAEA